MKKFLAIFLICTGAFFLVSVLHPSKGISLTDVAINILLGLVLSSILYFFYAKKK